MSVVGDKLKAAGKLFDERNAVYGDNHDRLAAVMVGLFPEGATLSTSQDHARYTLIALMVVKLTRYTVNWRNGGHSDSLKDLAVYATMLEALDENNLFG